MGMTLSPMAGMGSNGMGVGGGAGLSMPMLMAMMQNGGGGSQPAPTMQPLAGIVQHTPPMGGPTPGMPTAAPQQPPQSSSMTSMMPAIMQMLQHSGAQGAQGAGPSPAQALLNFFTGKQTGVVPQGVPGGMPTSAPGTTDTTGGIGGYMSLPGILNALSPNYAGPMPPTNAF